MNAISLNGDWALTHFPEGEHCPDSPQALKALRLPEIPASVPGNVELDLVRAGQLDDPFYASNIRSLRPLETHAWWYRRSFRLPEGTPGTDWTLVFDGLDTLATVWLNGVCLGQADNMLIAQRFPASHALAAGGENELVVRIASALNAARAYDYDALSMSWEGREEGLYLRKAPHVWGWDILPRAVSAGIWRDVRLEPTPESAIESLYFYTLEARPGQTDADGFARLGVRFQFRTPARSLDGFSLRFTGACARDGHAFTFEWPVEFVAGGCAIPVAGARLWWPKGYGRPDLYCVTTELLQEGAVVASREDVVGLRKLEVRRTELAGKPQSLEPFGGEMARIDSPPDPDSHFLFVVNDTPVQVRGSNWVPLDAFHARDAQRLDEAVGLLDDVGCNMVRCWGGNVYESDRFFSLCAERGILVWQDFAFACARYPQTPDFLERVRVEAEAVVARLRNFASLAIWCGDNEIDMAYLSEGLSPERNQLTRAVIPGVLHRLDPFRAYVPSSPYAPPAVFQQPDPWRATPEQHLWGPRNYFKSPFYVQHSAHFIGEIGYHGCPGAESIRKFISLERVWPWQGNPEWQEHAVYHWQGKARERDRIQLMANQVQEMFGFIPDDLEGFALASQIAQAEAKKFFIESTRARKWSTSGILWWNLLDGWPQFSDAVVDYYFARKLAYHYIWRAQRPALVMLGEAGSGMYLPLIVCNDTRQDVRGQYRVREAGGGEVLSGRLDVPANQTWQVGRVRTHASDQWMYLIEWEIEGSDPAIAGAFGNHYLSGSPPFSFERYREWLALIAGLPRTFRLG